MIPSARPHAVEPPTQFTRVDLTFIKDKIEQRIVFGRLADGHTIDKHRFIASFAAGSVFGVRRWAINAYGTTFARIDILRATAVGEPVSTVPFVRPGAEIVTGPRWPPGNAPSAPPRRAGAARAAARRPG